jgi:hypothetical protein
MLTGAQLPIWVDASVAIAPDRSPNHAVFGPETGLISEFLEKTPDGRCHQVGEMYVDSAFRAPRATLEEALTHSEVALLGRVTARAFGFYDLMPGQLLQVEPVRSFGSRLTEPRYYFFVPIGRFKVGDAELCKTDTRYPEPPDIGDEVFLFVDKPADLTGTLFHIQTAGDVVPVGAHGVLRIPHQYTDDPKGTRLGGFSATTKSDLIGSLRRSKFKRRTVPVSP